MDSPTVSFREILPIETPPEIREAERLLAALKAHCEAHGMSAVASVAPSRETIQHFAFNGPSVASVTMRTGPVPACVFLAGALMIGTKDRLDEVRAEGEGDGR